MKKMISCVIAVMLVICCLGGCGTGSRSLNDGKLDIVVTIFPVYDWVRNVVGDAPNVNVTLLLDNGTDMHSYQPSADDIITISTANVFIYVGGESDEWVEEVIEQSPNKDLIAISLLDILGDSAKEEEVIEGMEIEEEEEAEEETEYDEHVWLSLKNAKLFVKEIESAIERADSVNADTYRSNAEAYIEKLDELDKKYETVVSESNRNIVLFADRFPFRYMIDDYGLSYYAAFVGCSSETQASFQTITFLAKKTDEYSLPAVLTIEGETHNIAEAVIQNTSSKDRKILEMNSMQSVTLKNVNDGDTYLSIMEKNLETLKEALN